MSANLYTELSEEALLELLLSATHDLRKAIGSKASQADIDKKRRELQLIQKAIFERNPSNKIPRKST